MNKEVIQWLMGVGEHVNFDSFQSCNRYNILRIPNCILTRHYIL